MLSALTITTLLTLTAAGQAYTADMYGTAVVVRGESVPSAVRNGVTKESAEDLNNQNSQSGGHSPDSQSKCPPSRGEPYLSKTA